jgi:hypothetical protein
MVLVPKLGVAPSRHGQVAGAERDGAAVQVIRARHVQRQRRIHRQLPRLFSAPPSTEIAAGAVAFMSGRAAAPGDEVQVETGRPAARQLQRAAVRHRPVIVSVPGPAADPPFAAWRRSAWSARRSCCCRVTGAGFVTAMFTMSPVSVSVLPEAFVSPGPSSVQLVGFRPTLAVESAVANVAATVLSASVPVAPVMPPAVCSNAPPFTASVRPAPIVIVPLVPNDGEAPLW